MRRTIESYVIYLKKDLKIADTCATIKDQLLNALMDNQYFSKELSAYFVRENPATPFALSATDPAQVALLKKLLNSLERTEQTLRTIENINISPDRYTLKILNDSGQAIYGAIHNIYTALQLIQQSHADVQHIIGPHVQLLMQQAALASKGLEQFMPEHPEEQIGQHIAEMVTWLPKERYSETQGMEQLSTLLFSLPHYFEELRQIITLSHPDAEKKTTHTPESQEELAKKIQKMTREFEKLCAKNKLTRLPNYLAIVKNLMKHSIALINEAAPLTKEAYLSAASTLSIIKHQLLPRLIAELEQIEESMGLKTGLFTDPALLQMNKLYAQLAQYATRIAEEANTLDSLSKDMTSTKGVVLRKLARSTATIERSKRITEIPDLALMQDTVFTEQRKQYQINRLNEALLQAEDTHEQDAAKRFFARLETYNWLHQSLCKWSLANVNQSEKEAFIADYKQFQNHFAPLYPELDQLIVQALMHTNDGGILDKIYGTEYRQLWGSNHFKQILDCKAAVLSHIDQGLAQAQFKARLIQNSIAHTEAPDHLLRSTVAPFKPLVLLQEESQSPEQYHQKIIQMRNQLTHLTLAQKGAKIFFEQLSALSVPLHMLPESEKEELRRAYKQMQAPFVALGYTSFNNALVKQLNSPATPKAPILIQDLLALNTTVTTEWEQLIEATQQATDYYLKQETDARQKQEKSTSLTVAKTDLSKLSLFSMLAELKLSHSIDKFFNHKLNRYLKEKLSATVWMELSADGETIDASNLPFLEFHQDSQDVVFYKQLINSIYYIKIGLEKLECLSKSGDLSSIFKRTPYLINAFNALILNIGYSRYYLVQAAKNPAMADLIQDGVELLEPLKKLPLFAEYAQEAEPNEQETAAQDIISLWQQQQTIVRSVVSPEPQEQRDETHQKIATTPVKKTKPERSPNALIEQKLLQIQQTLYQIKTGDALPAEGAKEQELHIQSFIELISTMSFGPESTKKMLQALLKLQIQCSDIGALGREVTLSHLQEIRSELAVLLMMEADNAEFHFGLKPGSYSSLVSAQFDTMYSAFIQGLPLEKAQTGLELLLDTTAIQKRLAKEKERLEQVQHTHPGTETKKIVFGDEYKRLNELYRSYNQLKSFISQIKSNNSDTLDEQKAQVETIYRTIQPRLAELNPEFTEDFIQKCSDKMVLHHTLDTLFATRSSLFIPDGILTQIQALALTEDYANPAVQEQFLLYYQRIQPFLIQIDYTYDLRYFLRELRGAEDFKYAAEKIIADAGKLGQLVRGQNRAQAVKAQAAEERIAYFDALLNQHAKELGPKRIEAFKEQIFNTHLNAQVKKALELRLGTEAGLFLEFMMPDILAQKEKIFAGLRIKDDIEAVIIARVDAAVTLISTEKEADFKAFLFHRYTQQVVKEQLQSNLGLYMNWFLKHITPSYEARSEKLLSEIPFNQDLGSRIHAQIETMTPELLEQHQSLIRVFTDLNANAQQIDVLITQEQASLQNNPCRAKKLEQLQGLKKYLIELTIPQKHTIEFLLNSKAQLKRDLRSIEEQDALIEIYDVLNAMIVNIEQQDQGASAQEKIKTLLGVQGLLTNEQTPVATRLLQAMSRLKVSEQNKDNLLTTSSHALIGAAFKDQVFINYLNKEYTEQVRNSLGIYTEVFMHQLHPDFMAKKEHMIEKISVNTIIINIAECFNTHAPTVEEPHEALKKVCMQLNDRLQEVNQLIDQKIPPIPNPCREEKIRELKKLQQMLEELHSIPPDNPNEFLHQRAREAHAMMRRIKQYDPMVTLYEHLHQMEEYLANNIKESEELKAEKMQQIHLMKQKLTAAQEPKLRIAEVKKQALDEQCQAILAKDSDNLFLRLLKKLVHWFTGPSAAQHNLSLFNKQVQETPEIIEPDPYQAPWSKPNS